MDTLNTLILQVAGVRLNLKKGMGPLMDRVPRFTADRKGR